MSEVAVAEGAVYTKRERPYGNVVVLNDVKTSK